MDWLPRSFSCFARRALMALALIVPVLLQASIASAAEKAEAAATDKLPPELKEYVERQDGTFAWEFVADVDANGNRAKQYKLTSQKWRDGPWTHSLVIVEPKKMLHPKHVLMFISGGKTGDGPRKGDLLFGSVLANLCGARCAMLLQVPNQPMYGGHTEDGLITETFLRYLESKDPEWPLLFPMTKSAVRAMDAIQQIGEKDGSPVEKFVVTGGSKRGWTTWLTGVVDKRVVSIAPIVIDTLNFRVQMQHQLDTWGKYSEQIADYEKKGLLDVLQKRPEVPLWRWVDPYTYRSVLTMPKLIVNGTNDPYWVLDATNNYWSDLVGPKYIVFVPNAGHNLRGGEMIAFNSIGAFFRSTVNGRSLPKLDWKHSDDGSDLILSITSETPAKEAKLWVTNSETKDFRKSTWKSSSMERDGDRYVGKLPRAKAGHVALYGSLTFDVEGVPFTTSTQIRVE